MRVLGSLLLSLTRRSFCGSAMETNKLTLGYWEQRWIDDKIGWHRADVDKFLRAHHGRLAPSDGAEGSKKTRVLVPLCGKSVDMRFLMELGHQVIGVEFAPKAIEEFFAEHKMDFTKSQSGEFGVYTGENITIYQGDFFKVSTDVIGGNVDGVWDRASLVAMNPSDRDRYVSTITSVLTSSTNYLLESLSYNQDQHSGPPFSTPHKVVNELFKSRGFTVEQLEEQDNEFSMKKFATDSWKDALYLIRKE